MNYWTKLSIEYANQRSYLDDLFRVYPTIPNGIRYVDTVIWKNVELCFENQDNKNLIKNLLKLDLFPIKDSYVAYLRKDKSAIDRNPETINRLAGKFMIWVLMKYTINVLNLKKLIGKLALCLRNGLIRDV